MTRNSRHTLFRFSLAKGRTTVCHMANLALRLIVFCTPQTSDSYRRTLSISLAACLTRCAHRSLHVLSFSGGWIWRLFYSPRLESYGTPMHTEIPPASTWKENRRYGLNLSKPANNQVYTVNWKIPEYNRIETNSLFYTVFSALNVSIGLPMRWFRFRWMDGCILLISFVSGGTKRQID